jgi:hypothetical protein
LRNEVHLDSGVDRLRGRQEAAQLDHSPVVEGAVANGQWSMSAPAEIVRSDDWGLLLLTDHRISS